MRRLVPLAVALALLGAPSLPTARGHGGGSRSYSSHSSSPSSGGSRSVYVGGHTRKNESYVAPHYRSSPGSRSSFRSGSGSQSKATSYKHPPSYSTGGSVQRDSHGKIKRSASAKSDFRRQNPCPTTGKTTGRCPGYEVDHRMPLACGGADDPGNMQWLSATDNRHKGAMGCARR